MTRSLVLWATVHLVALPAAGEERALTLASTTSTESSGLFGHLLPRFTAKTGIRVRVVAVGTGAALRLGQRGDADAVWSWDGQAGDWSLRASGHDATVVPAGQSLVVTGAAN